MNLSPIKLQGLASAEQGIASELIEALSDVVRGVERAAKLWVQLGEDAQARFIDASPEAVRYLWERLTLIGERRLHPRLYSAEGRAAKAMARLPFKAQEKLLTHLVPVIVESELREMDATALTPEQAAQVFDVKRNSVHVRDVTQQKRFLAAKRRESAKLAKLSAEKLATSKIDRNGKWKIREGKAKIMPKLNSEGIDLETALQLVRDLRMVRKA